MNFPAASALLAALAASLVAALSSGALAQAPNAQNEQPAPDAGAVYKAPLRGAPGGRVGGASRGASKLAAALPSIELIAPLDHTGETATPAPTLYFYVSQAVALPTEFTISQPLRPAPVIEVSIASPPGRGLYAVRLADYRVRLEPGIVYTWSVSAIVDPRTWSRNVVASATMMRAPPDPALDSAANSASPPHRAAVLAQAGLWYDAIAAAIDGESTDRHATLDALLDQSGLSEPAKFDRGAVGPGAR